MRTIYLLRTCLRRAPEASAQKIPTIVHMHANAQSSDLRGLARILLSMTYSKKLSSILPPDMRRVFSKLNSPQKIQDFLESIPINFELKGETNLSPRQVLKRRLTHCFEGAVFAAAALAYHGHKPLLMDFATAYDDEDHTVALFKQDGLWGAISKTNHTVLRYRDPVYKTPRELAMSYFHEYFMWDGRKSLRAYSQPFDLSKLKPENWVIRDNSDQALDWLMKRLARSRYTEIAQSRAIKSLRRASAIEIKSLKLTEWKK